MAVRQHGWMRTRKGLWLACDSAGDSTGGRVKNPPRQCCGFCAFEQFDVVYRCETGLYLRKKRTTSLSGTLVFGPARCAHLLGNELKIDCLGRLLISALMLMIDHLTRDDTEVFSLSNSCFPAKCFTAASRCSASSASDHR